jgi:carbamoyltransferase
MILGIWDGHDAGACLVDPEAGRIVCAVNEERLTRRKLEVGFPSRSIETCLAISKDVSDVVATTTDPAKTLTRMFPSMKESYYRLRRRKVRPRRLDPLKRAFKYNLTTWRPNPVSRALSGRVLKNQLAHVGLGGVELTWVPHHLAHAASAAYTSGFSDALVVTLDGVGDGFSGSLSVLRDGKLAPVALIPARHSLGIFYEHVTQLMNMRELEDEGKVMALAAYGHPVAAADNPLMDLFDVEGSTLTCRLGPLSLKRFLARELAMVPSEQFAWMAQRVIETKVRDLVVGALVETGMKRVVYAGGVASNIQANLKLRDLPEVEALYVFPHMGDGGLALGAALARAVSRGAPPSFSLGDLRLGPEVSAASIETALEASGLSRKKVGCDVSEAAARLSDGQILLWFQGRMEYGPRALGGRSILARPDRPELRDRLNSTLKRRVWYQPFCPSILDGEAPRLLEDGDSPNRFMTMAYRVRPEARAVLSGVTSSDGTCRPQMVDASYGKYYELLSALRESIGVGAVLNTSFNVHGEPMVASPEDAISTFLRCGADALVIGEYLVEPQR